MVNLIKNMEINGKIIRILLKRHILKIIGCIEIFKLLKVQQWDHNNIIIIRMKKCKIRCWK